MSLGGVWSSRAERDAREIPLVWLHHDPRPSTRTDDEDGWSVEVSEDPWFDAMLMVMIETRDRAVSLALGLLLIGYWALCGVPAIVPTITPRRTPRIPIPAYFRTTVHATAPPRLPRGVALVTAGPM